MVSEPVTGSSAPPLLEEARILRPQSGDVIAITVDHVLSELEKDHIEKAAETLFPGYKVAVLERAEITIVRPEGADHG